jgi:hypothetical protein
VAGSVTAVTASQGVITTTADYVRVSTGAEGYLVEFSVGRDKVKDIKIGNTVMVKKTGFYYGEEARVVARGAPNESGSVVVKAQLTTTDWSAGDTVSVAVIYSDKQYWSCVPLAALRPDTGGAYYVLMLAERGTVLGTQTVAQKVTVTVQDKDNNFAAIEGVMEYNAQVIVSASKPVKDGDTVRVSGASTS